MAKTRRQFVFGLYCLDVQQRVLTRNGEVIPLAPKELDTLLALVENSSQLMHKEDLISRVWPDTFVGDGSLARNISVLRKILGKGIIQTVAKHGYRFVAPVEAAKTLLQPNKMPLLRLAVLPFANESADASMEYLVEGITEETIRGLGRAFGEQVCVVAMASMLRYRGTEKTLQQIARELPAQYLITGRVRSHNGRLRLQLELVEPREASSLWIESYEIGLQEDRGLQRRVAAHIASSLKTELLPSRISRPKRAAAIEARQAYLSGRYYCNRRSEKYVRRGIECFRMAISKDPNYAEAYAWLALSHIALASWGVAHPKGSMLEAQTLVRKALELDASLSELHVALAWTQVVLEKNWTAAQDSFRRAISLSPSNSWAYHWFAYFLAPRGRVSESLGLISRAVTLDPFSIPINSIRGWLLYIAGDYEAASARCRETVDLEPLHPAPHAYLAMAYEQLGNIEAAVREMELAADLSGNMFIIRCLLAHTYGLAKRRAEGNDIASELETISRSEYVCAYYMAVMYAGLGRYDKTAIWLQRSLEDGDPWALYAEIDPRLSAFRADRKFPALEIACKSLITDPHQNPS